MRFGQKLIRGTLIRRYKRFLADVRLDSGELITAHTANSGSMLGLAGAGNTVYLSHHDEPKRKLKYTWEIVRVGKVAVGINTHLPNHLVEEGIREGVIRELQGYAELRREVPYGERSRIDFLLSDKKKGLCFVEVKSVTLVQKGMAFFPDAVSERGRKHLNELARMVAEGHRGVMLFVLQRSDGRLVAPADHIDPRYGEVLRRVARQGVEMLAYRARVGLREIRLEEPVGFSLENGFL